MEIGRKTPESIQPGLSQDQAAKYLLDLQDPLSRVQQGLAWMESNGHSVDRALRVTTIILNNAGSVANELQSLREKNTPQSQQPKSPIS